MTPTLPRVLEETGMNSRERVILAIEIRAPDRVPLTHATLPGAVARYGAALRDMILSVMVRRVQRLCQLPGLDGIHFRDDWGTQQALMISPHLWRTFFKPAYARLFALARDAGKHVWFHSDGVIGTIISDLIEIGVQVLNPQVSVIGREKLASLCRG
jgi:hypothetical protein